MTSPPDRAGANNHGRLLTCQAAAHAPNYAAATEFYETSTVVTATWVVSDTSRIVML